MTLSTIQPIGKKPVDDAEQRGAQRHARRHGEDEDRDEDGDDQRDHRRDVRLHLAGGDQHQQRDDRQRRRERRQDLIGKRIVDLVPHDVPRPRHAPVNAGRRLRQTAPLATK